MRIFNIKHDLNKTDKERKEHLSKLKNILHDDDHYCIFNFLYDNLNIIDNKASSLLTYNSLIIAGIAIILSMKVEADLITFLYISAIFVFIISSIFCLKVVYLHWSSTTDLQDPAKHLDEILVVREKRSINYRFSWYLSFMSTIYIGLLIVFNVIIIL